MDVWARLRGTARRGAGYGRTLAATRSGRWTLAGVGAVALALLVWAVLPETAATPPRARQYVDFTGCLLTDEHGITGPDAAPMWAGLQDASAETHVRVQFLEIVGEQTADNAATFASSLAQSHCDLIFAAGPVATSGVRQSASAFPRVRFYLVGAATRPGSNISTVDGPSREAVRDAVVGYCRGDDASAYSRC
ncbi:BMP family ABC transporter substrate-binding protein [Plantactinospora sp. KBS50]|uniref:BMP family ABC transporter substrate-binding protein n=1 Tax=Plantactinospora sp. KBS50 TaxID=2024580 RepID=UPI000BAAE315|nr:BMP family ABC transporter substrate-binding protein [Plantactinospora sp. KBS50]ASW53377.1 hypothetical protein CIK06_03015 [Plantactinospora sp. KBS50]